MVKVMCEIKVKEMDQEPIDFNQPAMGVQSHWCNDNLVVLVIRDSDGGIERSVTVVADELIAATNNAINT